MTGKNRKTLKTIKIPILNSEYSVWVLWGDKNKALKWIRKELEDKNINFDDLGYRGRTFNHTGYHPVIYIAVETHFYATVAHEAIHAIDFIWDFIGEKQKGGEIYAHSIGAIVNGVEKKRKNE